MRWLYGSLRNNWKSLQHNMLSLYANAFFGTEMMGRKAFVETLLACHIHQVWGCMRWQPLHPKIHKGEKIGLVKICLEILTFAWCWLIVTSFFRISRLDTWAQVSLMHFLSSFSALLAWELLNIEVVCKTSVFFGWVPQVQRTFWEKPTPLKGRVFDWFQSPKIQRHGAMLHLRMCFSALGIFERGRDAGKSLEHTEKCFHEILHQ